MTELDKDNDCFSFYTESSRVNLSYELKFHVVIDSIKFRANEIKTIDIFNS